MLAAALLPCFIFTITAAAPVTMDTSNVYEDLKKMTINGAAFDENNYPENKEADYISVLSFLEYGYAENGDQSNYGIYIYVYNPSKKNILNSTKNKIQIAGVADKDSSETYHKYELDELSRYDGGLYIKYKISNLKPASAPKILYDYVKPSERIYKVSGIELHESGKYNATDFPVSGTYAYTGYQKGYAYNLSAESSLACNQENLTTIKLDLHHTTYRTLTSSAGLDHQNEIMSVYFAVPKELYDQYEYLHSVQGEYYKYKIRNLVTTSQDAFNEWDSFTAVRLSQIPGATEVIKDGKFWWYHSDFSSFYSSDYNDEFFADNLNRIHRTYNTCLNEIPVESSTYSIDYKNPFIWVPYIYYVPSLSSDGTYDVLPQEVIDKVNDKGLMPQQEGIYEDDFVEGYTKYDICFEDKYKLAPYASTHSWWDFFVETGDLFGYFRIDKEDLKTVTPFEEVTDAMLNHGDDFISKNYYVYIDDVDKLRDYYEEKTSDPDNENVVLLFRFSANDYYEESLIYADKEGVEDASVKSYLTSQTYIKDFDVMSLTFMDKSDNLVVIPVAADPIDIVGGLNQVPVPDGGWVWQLVGIILGAVMIGFLAWVVYEIFSMIAESIDARRG